MNRAIDRDWREGIAVLSRELGVGNEIHVDFAQIGFVTSLLG